jgi:hypothetical protein
VRLALLLAAMSLAAQPAKAPATRAELAPLEKRFDARLSTLGGEDPCDLLGNTRGVYLENYGVVFTTELSLVAAPAVTPFRPAIPKEMAAKVRDRKLTRVPLLKKTMVELMTTAATALRDLPGDQQIVYGVSLHYYSWEDTSGLPAQIVMQAPRRSLMDRGEPAVRVREY